MCVAHGKPCVNMLGVWNVINKGGFKQVEIITERKERKGKGRREKKERKERKERKGKKKKKRERKEGRKEMRKGTGTNVAQGAELDDEEPITALQEVGFLLLWLFYSYGPHNGLTVSPHFRANLRCVWFGCCCVTVKDRFHGVSGLSKTEHCVPRWKNPEQNGKRGCAQISAHPC